MGHLINPIAIRLSINNSWNSNWALTNNFNYNSVFKKDYLVFSFLNSFINRKHFTFTSFYVSHYKMYRLNNINYINLYLYTPLDKETKFRFLKNFLFKMKWKKHFRKNKILLDNYNVYKKMNNKRKYAHIKLQFQRIYKFFYKFLITYLVSYTLSRNFNYYLTKMDYSFIRYDLNAYLLHHLSLTPQVITKYISVQLQQRYSLRWVLKPILKDLNKRLNNNFIKGYKLLCSGRFSKRQRATYTWVKKGSVPLNNFTNVIKYSQMRVRLKFGLGGIKLWMHYGHERKVWNSLYLSYPRYSPFKFFFDKKKSRIIVFFNYWCHLYLKVCNLGKVRQYNSYKLYMRVHLLKLMIYLSKNIYLNKKKYNIRLDSNNKVVIFLKRNTLYKTLNKLNNNNKC